MSDEEIKRGLSHIIRSLLTGVDPQYDNVSNSEIMEILSGGAGDDLISGSVDADYIDGGNDNDVLIGNFGNDYIFGGQGANDTTFNLIQRKAA